MFLFNTFKNFILDILFPVHCLGCDLEGDWMCQSCLQNVSLQTQQTCPICRIPGTGRVCPGCRRKTALDGLFVACHYEQPVVQACIHSLKYLGVVSLALPIATYLWHHYKTSPTQSLFDGTYAALTPVPLHPRRRRYRGFNQSALIAKEFSKLANLSVSELLIRKRYTESQMTLSRPERLTNVVGAFACAPGFEKIPENVIIIDDVATTLATLHECASVLKSHGAKTVWGLVVARGS